MCMLDTPYPTGIIIAPSLFLHFFFLSVLAEDLNCQPLVFTYILVPLVLTSPLHGTMWKYVAPTLASSSTALE